VTLAAKPERRRVLLPGTASELPERLTGRTLLPAWEVRRLPGLDAALFDRLLGQGAFTWYDVGSSSSLGFLDLREVLLELGRHSAPAPAPAASSGKPAAQPAKRVVRRPKRKEKEAWMVDVPPPALAADPVGHWSDEF